MKRLSPSEIIRAPVVTERSNSVSQFNQIIFLVDLRANKPMIKASIERLFGVKVKAVNTLRRKGKIKRFRGFPGRRKNTKKAVVTLEEGHSIDIATGL